MTVIHSSSQPYIPATYNKPQPVSVVGNKTPAVLANDGKASNTASSSSPGNALSSIEKGHELSIAPSSLAQIKPSLNIATPPNNDNAQKQPSTLQLQKALNTYTQNYHQTNQPQLAASNSGIDLYA